MPVTAPGWDTVNEHHLHRRYEFPDFKSALEFVNRVGAVAEEQSHHPDIALTWGKVDIKIFTHTINGLSDKDFALASAINRMTQGDRT